jgi:thiopeptide-type bacteriocin biosynthesis protein
LNGKKINRKLEAFKSRFTQRYEDNEMPLLEVLDAETGIGYAQNGGMGNQSLIEDIQFPDEEQVSRRGERSIGEHMLHKRIRQAELTGCSVITIESHEIDSLPQNKTGLPPSMAFLFRLPAEGLVHLEGVFGSSAINLLGRFAHADTNIREVIQKIAAWESAHNPDVIFAEIVHLPETRTGNILLRPVIRDHEIPFLAQSSLPEDQQIHLQDLYVTVRNNKVRLFSKKLKKEIVPRLGTAHNYGQQSLPLYHFLCDLQAQDIENNLTVKWTPAAYDSIHLPRLVYKNIILGLATWQLDNKDLEVLTLADAASLPVAFKEFQQRWKLPDLFTLADGDRELLVDATQPSTIMSWLETIRKRSTIVLKEFIFDASNATTNRNANTYVNQFVAPLLNPKNVYPKIPSPRELNAPHLPHNFSLGSEWLYYKIYCGEQSIDKILVEVIAPLVENLQQHEFIDYWFFIRYYDPDCHLRVRFHLPDTKKIGDVISTIYTYITPLKTSGHIWKLQTCTYQRELSRYGTATMVLSEQLFYCDSMNVLGLITAGSDVVNEQNRWIWGIYSIDKMLSLFKYPLASRLALMQGLKESFANEFKVDKNIKLQIDQKYRQHRAKIDEILAMSHESESKHLFATDAVHELTSSIAAQIEALAERNHLDVSLDLLLASYIHMHVNRLMQSSHREHELLKYDFLYRHYRSQSAIQQQSAPLTSSLP